MRQTFLDRICERYLDAMDAFDVEEMTAIWKLAERVPGLERALLDILKELDEEWKRTNSPE